MTTIRTFLKTESQWRLNKTAKLSNDYQISEWESGTRQLLIFTSLALYQVFTRPQTHDYFQYFRKFQKKAYERYYDIKTLLIRFNKPFPNYR